MRYYRARSAYLNPWLLGKDLFQPTGADPSERFQRLSDWRARLGALLIVVLSLSDLGFTGLVWSFIGNASINMLGGSVIAGSAVGIYWISTPGGPDPRTRSLSRDALRRVLLSVGVTIGLGIIARTGLIATLPVLGWLVGFWLLGFGLSMMWYCLRWVFGVGDVDKLLGPTVTVLTALVALALDAAQPLEAQPAPQSSAAQLIKVSGVVTVCLLALWEFLYHLRLRRLAGPSRADTRTRPAPYRPGTRPAGPAPWNKLAIAAIIGVFLCWPVAAALAIIALRQVPLSGERGRLLAWASIVLAVVAGVSMCIQVARLSKDPAENVPIPGVPQTIAAVATRSAPLGWPLTAPPLDSQAGIGRIG